MSYAMDTFMNSYVIPLSGFLIFLGVVVTAIQILANARNPKERSEKLGSLMYVGIGGIILGGVIMLSGLVVGVSQDVIAPSPAITQGISGTLTQENVKEEGGFVSRMLSGFTDEINEGLNWILAKIAPYNNNSGTTSTSSFMNSLLFKQGDQWIPQKTWNNMYAVFVLLALGLVPLVSIAIAKTGIQFTLSAFNTRLRIEAQESISRWFLCVAMVAVAPIFVQAMWQLNDGLVQLARDINPNVSMNGVLTDIKTGSVFLTSLVKLSFTLLSFYVAVLFEIRKIMIIVFFVTTSIAAYLWAINKNVNASMVWFGEMLSNIFMQFFYALVFVIFSVFSGNGSLNWLQTLIWLVMIVAIAEMLRNGMQGLYTRLSGINEAQVASKFARGALGSVGVLGGYKAMKTTFGNPTNPNTTTSDGSNNTSNNNTSGGNPPIPTGGGNAPVQTMSMNNSSSSSVTGGNITGNNISGGNTSSDSMSGESIGKFTAAQVMDSQNRMKSNLGRLNNASNAIGRAVAMPLVLAAAPFGKEAMHSAMGVGQFVGGSLRAVGTPLAMGVSAYRTKSVQGNNLSFADNLAMMTNSTDGRGTITKMKSITHDNTAGNHQGLESTFKSIDPNSKDHFVRWHYAPSTSNVDTFRYNDKAVQVDNSNVKKGGQRHAYQA